MQQAFVFEKVAVLVGPWHEPMEPPERGARVEVRLLADEPRRGSRSAAQRLVVDQPVFRADLFDQVDGPPGNLRSAHFHPRFHGVEPCDRSGRFPGRIGVDNHQRDVVVADRDDRPGVNTRRGDLDGRSPMEFDGGIVRHRQVRRVSALRGVEAFRLGGRGHLGSRGRATRLFR